MIKDQWPSIVVSPSFATCCPYLEELCLFYSSVECVLYCFQWHLINDEHVLVCVCICVPIRLHFCSETAMDC